MRRTLRILAICAFAYSIAQAWYSLGQLATYPQVFALFPQVVRSTNWALGIATAVVALVDSAQHRRWWHVGAFGALVPLTTYAGYLPIMLFPLIPALNSLGVAGGLRLYLLSYAVPTILTALLILAGEMFPRLAMPHLTPAHEQDDGLEIHYSSLER